MQDLAKTDQETLRELSNLDPDECLSRIATELKLRLNCETSCILLWSEGLHKDAQVRQVLVTEYSEGLPERLDRQRYHFEIYRYGDGITGGYIFADRKAIRARVFLDREIIYDDEVPGKVKSKSIKWNNMKRFGMESRYGDFASLLGVPLIVRNQRIGVVKLINKLDDKSDRLAVDGFKPDDLSRLKNFLSTIELVIETKTNEKQIKNLFAISEKVISSDFTYDELLQEIAESCADTLNLKACIIRLLDRRPLKIMGNSLGQAENKLFDESQIAKRVMETQQTLQILDGVVRATTQPELSKIREPRIMSGRRHGLNSCLAVPIIYQKKAIGVIECYTFLRHEFSSHQLAAVNAYGTLIATLFQRNKAKEAIASLVESFSLLSSAEDVYHRVMKLIESYLDTEFVSIWEKHAQEEGFVFELVKASDQFRKKLDKSKIQSVTDSSVTANAANANKILHFNAAAISGQPLEHQGFIKKQALRSLTMVPIAICGKAHAVIDVFYDEDKTLLKEEEDFLRLLSAKAAEAIWNKKLTLSFKEISDGLLSAPDVGTILKLIANVARRVLYSDLVILFEYEAVRREFMPPERSGHLFVENIYDGKKTKQKDFVNLMLGEAGPLYLAGTEKYLEFCEGKGTVRPSYPDDFWHREKICSLAAIRLVDGRGNPVGVMFVNYRADFEFDGSTKKVIESFASQAAWAIVSARFKGRRIQELLSQEMIANLIKNLDVLLDLLNLKLISVSDQSEYEGIVNARDLGQLDDLLRSVAETRAPLAYIRDFLNDAQIANHNIKDLIERLLAFLSTNFSGNDIAPECDYQENIPEYLCDANQVYELLYHLSSILLDARTTKGAFRVKTRYQQERNTIDVELEIHGGRISDAELQKLLDQPIGPEYGDGVPLPGRFQLIQARAQSHRATIKKVESPGGLCFTVNFMLD